MEQSKETLLIVDDSRLQRAVLNEIFSPAFNILEVSSGEECLQMIKDKKNMIRSCHTGNGWFRCFKTPPGNAGV